MSKPNYHEEKRGAAKVSDIEKKTEQIKDLFWSELRKTRTPEDLEEIRVKFLGKKGEITSLLKSIKNIDPSERPRAGQVLNQLKEEIEQAISQKKSTLLEEFYDRKEEEDSIDVSLPPRGREWGGFHPVAQVMEEVVEIFASMGFTVAYGPEIENDFYNFEALNIPPHHPARDMQDTFYTNNGLLLRTHTSPVEVRAMRQMGAPLRIVVPGKVYRRDNDPTHSPMFHQLEGLLIDEDISVADLKGCLEAFANRIFERPLKVRYRASYFPFTEPSLEMDVECVACSGRNPECRICKGTGWLEIAGMGMTHPNVLIAGGIDPQKYNGFAWGMGLDRIAMLKYGLDDLRVFFEGDLAFLIGGRQE
ncbi:phenylalanyl-tRNA synthetase, alpha subunit [Thermovirga lienii DSM 17291]|jgi:phenylalanyl-tRNA synthetase alpha chain|uniref:Phenylalanine--tRNA ligase alpha subunit n=1 Tax=Thermovirga lienii (strain ATCC BAA-1197 / DSM 17291 / Cas60314) TaxID=580340 RepID=G7V997_THELD|nr:phenylalanine--tRNA ligase subunit alpha [Thermovirga lienii]MDN5318431.1 phenylalanyl-tRNA synthetase alpha chain [Thermovirga sp.]AER66466.1 phenylalanyl-tRNA synthetase, alpha subunit [Thermovirga lienii DSM 17291]KUK42303.1 MAG: Phenylalanine--tRNA ligase alpha subunit [Thermovirga lienii]MDN5368110.1 phenylalanyl-tRNA synthetase alpha chain [Thermovirga sp.]HCD72036.1 phenylalanine--tRNA ligase subunit alpha [Thermovirga lienii]